MAASSRFLEGSMNDRTSAAPPLNFLGPEDAAAYEQRFYDANHRMSYPQYQHPQHHWPTSSAGQAAAQQQQSNHHKRGSFFLAPLWDGVREKLHLTKSKSTSSIGQSNGQKLSKENKTSERMEKVNSATSNTTTFSAFAPGAASAYPAATPAVGTGTGADNIRSTQGLPSREEVHETYKNLMASGFFDQHVIHGTRHPLRVATSQPQPESESRPPLQRQSRSFPAVPNGTGIKALSERAATAQTRPPPPVPVSSFSSIPYSATISPPPAERPIRAMAPPPPPPNLSRPSTATRPSSSSSFRAFVTGPSPQRGTKRGMDDGVDGPEQEVESGARKLVKKLRKSASRISIDLSLMQSRPRPSTSSDARPPMPLLSRSSSIFGGKRDQNEQQPRPSLTTVRAAPPPAPTCAPPPPPVTTTTTTSIEDSNNISNRLIKTPTKKLTKSRERRKLMGLTLGRRRSRSRSRGPSPPPPSTPESRVVHTMAAKHERALSTDAVVTSPKAIVTSPKTMRSPGVMSDRVLGDEDILSEGATTDYECEYVDGDDDEMAIDSPEQITVHTAIAVPVHSVPSFHYPQRQRTLPLSVVPDPNRGIPSIPIIPSTFKSGVNSGNVACSTNEVKIFSRDSAVVGAEDVENQVC
ncbi:hypothetical protein QBC46DRAFT_1272 [Diplogelasinospora grovesii]|uniref:Uncharacterized protein n=1 Tax=Diplogelasinospora grovesii TaxID=303347 RepID=A0AAN6S9M0_9PEZI|nr:hypothetical protein QBC46DRAFT_1272 [Diplogelasinospora grovesii]